MRANPSDSATDPSSGRKCRSRVFARRIRERRFTTDYSSPAGRWPTVAAIVAGTGRWRVPPDLRGVFGKMAVIPVPRARLEEG